MRTSTPTFRTMSSDSWTEAWQLVSPHELQRPSPPPDLAEAVSDSFFLDNMLKSSPKTLTNSSMHITSDSPLSTLPLREPPVSQPSGAYTDWEASHVVEEEYWRSSHDIDDFSTLPAHAVTSSSIIYRVATVASDEDCVMQRSAAAPSPMLTPREEKNEALPSSPQLYSTYAMPSTATAVATAHAASFTDANTSSTILTVHGDFAFTTRALRKLDQRGSNRCLLPSPADHAALFQQHGDNDNDEDGDKGAVVPMVRGTLIVKNHGTGYLLDWKPSFTLVSGYSSSYSGPGLLLRDSASPAADASCSKMSCASPPVPPRHALNTATAAFVPPRGLPAWTSDYHEEKAAPAAAAVTTAQRIEGKEAETRETPSGPLCSTAPTVPRPAKPGGHRRSTDLPPRLALSLFQHGSADASVATTAAPRKAASMPVLPSVSLTTPPQLAADQATLLVTRTAPVVWKSPLTLQSEESSGSTVTIQLPVAETRCGSPPPPDVPLPRCVIARGTADLQPPPPSPSASAHTVSLLKASTTNRASWLLLSSSSDADDDTGGGYGGMAVSPARLVGTGDGGDYSDGAIALRPAVPTSYRSHQPAQPSRQLQEKESAADHTNIGDSEASTDGCPHSPCPATKKKKKAKKSKKSKPGRCSRSTSLSRDLPHACTASASLYRHSSRSTSDASKNHTINDSSISLSVNAASTSSFLASKNGGSVVWVPLPPSLLPSSLLSSSCSTSLRRLQRAPLFSGAPVASSPGKGAAVNGNLDANEVGCIAGPSSRGDAMPAQRAATIRNEAMQAFPSIPAVEQRTSMGMTNTRAARRHSPVRAASPDDARVLGRRSSPPQQLLHSAAQCVASPPQRTVGSPGPKKRQTTRIIKVSPWPTVCETPPSPLQLSTEEPQPACETSGERGVAHEKAASHLVWDSSDPPCPAKCSIVGPPSPPARLKGKVSREPENSAAVRKESTTDMQASRERTLQHD